MTAAQLGSSAGHRTCVTMTQTSYDNYSLHSKLLCPHASRKVYTRAAGMGCMLPDSIWAACAPIGSVCSKTQPLRMLNPCSVGLAAVRQELTMTVHGRSMLLVSKAGHLLGCVDDKRQAPPVMQRPPPQLLSQCCAPASL